MICHIVTTTDFSNAIMVQTTYSIKNDMAVTAAILEIFSVKEWPDLEIRNFVKMFDARKTGMIGLPYGGKTMTIR